MKKLNNKIEGKVAIVKNVDAKLISKVDNSNLLEKLKCKHSLKNKKEKHKN